MIEDWSKSSFDRFSVSFTTKGLHVAAGSVVVALFLLLGVNQLIHGEWWRGGKLTGGLLVVTTGMAVGMPYVTAIWVRRSTTVPGVYWVQATSQLLWLYLIAWVSHPVVAAVAVLLLFSASVNDTRYLYDSKELQTHTLVSLVPIAALLFLLDVEGNGILSRWESNRTTTIAYLAGAVLVTILVLFVVKVVGAQWRALDGQLVRSADLAKRLAATSAENEAVRKASGFLEQGIMAGRFSHDVSSPLSILHFGVEHFEDAEVSKSFDEADNEMMELMAEATARLIRESRKLAAAIRGTTVETRQVQVLVDDAIRFSRLTGAGIAGVSEFRVETTLEDATVHVTEQHVGALADIMSNAARASASTPVEIVGKSTEHGFYEISIRDFGVKAGEQEEAAARVQAVFDLDGESIKGSKVGLGIGLSIAKLTAVRYGGSLRVDIPSGDGLSLTMSIPKASPTETIA